MSTASAVIAEARKHLGYYKKPGTKTKFGEFYEKLTGQKGYAAAQWCAMFVTYVASAAGAQAVIPAHAYTPSGVNWFKAKKQWHAGLKGVRAGDIVYFNFGNLGRVSHIGIVESVNKDGSVNTIEGNTSSRAAGDQRNSGTVARKRRKAYIVGYGRPAYKSAPAKPSGKTISQLADEVMANKHGNGDDRKKALGKDHAAVQAEVNRRVKAGEKPSSKPPVAPPANKGKKDFYQLGDYGYDEVEQLQSVLNKWYPGLTKLAVDGNYGSKTSARVLYLQTKSRGKLKKDSVAGPATLKFLGIRK